MTRPTPENTTVDMALVAEGLVASKRDRCLICGFGFDDDHAVLRVRDHQGQKDFVLHRRCVEKLLSTGPVDGDTAAREFERYRRKIMKRIK